MSSKETDIKDSSKAAKKLIGNQVVTEEDFQKEVEELNNAIKRVDELVPEGPSMDVASELRSGLDFIANIAELPLGTEMPDRINHYLRSIMPAFAETDGQRPANYDAAVAVSIVRGIGLLGAAMVNGREHFIANNESKILRNEANADIVFGGIAVSRKVLQLLIPDIPEQKAIAELQNEVFRQVTSEDIDKAALSLPETKAAKAKKIGRKIIGPTTDTKNLW